MFFTLQIPMIDLRGILCPESINFPISGMELFANDTKPDKNSHHAPFVRAAGCFEVENHYLEAVEPPIIPYRQKNQAVKYLESDLNTEKNCISIKRGLRLHFSDNEKFISKFPVKTVRTRKIKFKKLGCEGEVWPYLPRIELGIGFLPKKTDATPLEPLNRKELLIAIRNFLNFNTWVPSENAERSVNDREAKKQLPLVAQCNNLADLYLASTTPYDERIYLKLSTETTRILTLRPILAIFYASNEISQLPNGTVQLNQHPSLTAKVGIWHSNDYDLDVYFFQIPEKHEVGRVGAKQFNYIRAYALHLLCLHHQWDSFYEVVNAIADKRITLNDDSSIRMEGFLEKNIQELKKAKIMNYDCYTAAGVGRWKINKMICNFKNALNKLENDFPKITKMTRLMMGPQIKVFLSYSHHDKKFRNFIYDGVKSLVDDFSISYYDDFGNIAGDRFDEKIRSHLEQASVVILLISENFKNSNYIKTKEIPIVIRRVRQESGNEASMVRVIPILLSGKIPKRGVLSEFIFLNPRQPLSTLEDEQKKFDFVEDLKKHICMTE